MSQSLKIDNLPFLPQNWISPPKLIRGPPQYQQGAFLRKNTVWHFEGATQTSLKKRGQLLLKNLDFLSSQLLLGLRQQCAPSSGELLENNDYRSWIKAAFHKLGFFDPTKAGIGLIYCKAVAKATHHCDYQLSF